METIAEQLVGALANKHLNVAFDPHNDRTDAPVLVSQAGEFVTVFRFARPRIVLSTIETRELIGIIRELPDSDPVSVAWAAFDCIAKFAQLKRTESK
jgi:hypothetical protein